MKALRVTLLGAPPLVACALLSWACSSDRSTNFDVDANVTPIDANTGDASAGDASGKPPFDPTEEAVTCATTPCAVEIVAGENHFCARMNDGTVRCWGGANDAGALAVEALTNATQLSASGRTTCALVADGDVDCWGRNNEGQLGFGEDKTTSDSMEHPTPSRVALASAARRVDVGPSSACAVLVNGEVWCWGDNSRKQLARATPEGIGRPAKAEMGELRVTRTAASRYTGFALTDQGTLLSWGAVAGSEGSVSGRISSLSPDARPFPVGLGQISSFATSTTRIVAASWPNPARGIAHACAVVSGEIFCWGDSVAGAIGDGLTGLVSTPVHAALESQTAWARQVVVADEVTCARLTDGTVECTGDNTHGALATDTPMQLSLAFRTALEFHEHAVQLAASSASICAVVQGGGVLCWGSNASGELGQGSVDLAPHVTPLPVDFEKAVP